MPSPESQDNPALRPVQRTTAHAVVRNAAGGLLMVRSGPSEPWFLPGGVLRHGEHPRDGVLRELVEQTGLQAGQAAPRDATADVIDVTERGVSLHTLRLIYDVELIDDVELDDEQLAGGSDLVRFVDPGRADVASLLAPPDLAGGENVVRGDVVFVQRPAAYAVLVAEALEGQQILLTLLSGSGGTWTLPGGGIDHGEHPLVALVREIYEETGLPYTVGPLIDIDSRHFVGRAPTGRLEDFHGLRLIYAGSVPVDVPPQVTEVNGSTEHAAWIPVADLDRIGAVRSVREGLERWTRAR